MTWEDAFNESNSGPLTTGQPGIEVGEMIVNQEIGDVIDLDNDGNEIQRSRAQITHPYAVDTIYSNLRGEVLDQVDDVIDRLNSGEVVSPSEIGGIAKKALAPFKKGGSKSRIIVGKPSLGAEQRAMLEKIFDGTKRDLKYPLLSVSKGSILWDDMGYFSKSRDFTSGELLQFSKMNLYTGTLYRSRRKTAVATSTGVVTLNGFSTTGEKAKFLAINIELSSTSFKNVADAKFKISTTLGNGYDNQALVLHDVWGSFEKRDSTAMDTNFSFKATIIPYVNREDGGKMSTLGVSSDTTPLSITISGIAEGTSCTARILGPENYLV